MEVIIIFDWLGDFIGGIGDSIGSTFEYLGTEISNAIWDTMLQWFCFDNDEAGQTANKRIAEKLNKMNIQNEILIPKHKDWNEDLTLLEKGKGDICQAL